MLRQELMKAAQVITARGSKINACVNRSVTSVSAVLMMIFTGTIHASATVGAGTLGTLPIVGIAGAAVGTPGALAGTVGMHGIIHGDGIPGTLLLFAYPVPTLLFPDPALLKTVRV